MSDEEQAYGCMFGWVLWVLVLLAFGGVEAMTGWLFLLGLFAMPVLTSLLAWLLE